MKITKEMINPEIRRRGTLIRKIFNFKNEKSFVRIQGVMHKARGGKNTKELHCSERNIQTPDNPRLRLCVYTSHNPKPDAVGLLWIHGGGYGIGKPEQDVGFIQKFIEASNCVVVSPDYRLSIHKPYPAAVNDCYQSLLWMKDHANELGIRKDQLFVGGDSAGGGLTAAITLMARNKGEVSVAFQMPFYPMLDDRMITPSSQDNDAPIWNTRANEVAWKMYLGDLYGTEDVPTYAAPARETNYAGLPPTYTFVGDIEPFCDETKEYIANLQRAGVKAEIDVYPGCFHGFDIICSKSGIARKATEKYIAQFKYAVEHYYSHQK